jgi:S-sulfosulfanyl-L-cysteine sulfohydrolase
MNLSIVYFNDVHGYADEHPELFYEGSKEVIKTTGGYSRIAGYIKQVKSAQSNTLVFDGGDTFHGTLPVVESQGEALLPILTRMEIDAMVGHWDFAYGPQQLKNLAAQLNYPVLGINVYNEDGTLFLKPYVLKETGGIRVGIIGICSNIIDKTMPKRFSEGLKITDGTEELPLYVQKVKDEGANLVILISHNGFPQDCYLLSKTTGINICFSAHTHNRLYEAVEVNNTVIIQCGCHGSFVGHLDLEVENNKVLNYRYQLKAVDESLPTDAVIDAKVKALMAPYASLQSDIVGTTPQTLHRYNILNATMDNLLLAAIQWKTGSALAFSNGWRYGVPMEKGKITRFQLYNIVPHNPVIETVELSGEEVWQMLEENLERTFSSDPMQQLGGYVKRCMGLTAYIKIENPKGNRVQELFIGNEHCEMGKRYTASFVTEQGIPQKYGSNRKKTETQVIDAMVTFLRADLLTETIVQSKAIISI